MKNHPFRWALVGFGIAVAIGLADRIVREVLALQAEEETTPAESQPQPREMQPAA